MKKKVERVEIIKKRFRKEWLLIGDYKTDKMNRIVQGVLIAHSKNRDDIYRKLRRYKKPLAIQYSGPIPKDLAVMF